LKIRKAKDCQNNKIVVLQAVFYQGVYKDYGLAVGRRTTFENRVF